MHSINYIFSSQWSWYVKRTSLLWASYWIIWLCNQSYIRRHICLQACVLDGESANYLTKILIGGVFLRWIYVYSLFESSNCSLSVYQLFSRRMFTRLISENFLITVDLQRIIFYMLRYLFLMALSRIILLPFCYHCL